MIDGVSAMDTGNNGLMGRLEPAGGRRGRGQGDHVRLIGRVRPIERHAGLRRHQERHEPVPLVAVPTTSAIRIGTRIPGPTRRTAIPSRSSQQLDLGYTLGGPVGKPGGNNKLFFFYSHEFRPRRTGTSINRFRLPTALERRGDFSQTLDQNGELYTLIYDAAVRACPRAACSATDDDGLLPGRRGRRPDSAQPVVRPRASRCSINIRCPTSRQRPGRATTTRSRRRFSSTSVLHAGDSAGLPRVIPAAADRQMGRAERARASRRSARCRDSTTRCRSFRCRSIRRSPPTTPSDTTTFSRSTYGVNQNRLGSPPIGPHSNRNSVVCPPDLAALSPNCTLGRIALLFPDAGVIDPRYYEYRRAPGGGCAVLPGRPEPAAAAVGRSAPGRPAHVDGRVRRRVRAAEPELSRLHEHQPDAGRAVVSVTQRRRAAHREGGPLRQPQLQGAEPQLEPEFPGPAEFRQRHDQSARHGFPVRERRDSASSRRTRSSRASSRAAFSTTTSSGSCRTTGRSTAA